MNTQELIKKIENMPYENGILMDFVKINRSWLLKTIKQLEPDKVTIPQYIADEIEYCKESDDYSLFHAIDYCYNFKKCASWLMFKSNIEIFALAWIFGYKVEKEPKYTVKVKKIHERYIYLKWDDGNEYWYFGEKRNSDSLRLYHTRKELEEAGFGWVFDCEGIEVEEVEE